MRLTDKHTNEQGTSIALDEAQKADFSRRLAASDGQVYTLLKSRQINSFHALRTQLLFRQSMVRRLRIVNGAFKLGLIFMAAISIFCGFWFYQIEYQAPMKQLRSWSESMSQIRGEDVKLLVLPHHPDKFHLSRNIFEPVVINQVNTDQVFERQHQQFLSSFKIVGIVLDEEPRIIVEDVTNQTTLFVGVDDRLGGATVIAIDAGQIVYELLGQTRTMKI